MFQKKKKKPRLINSDHLHPTSKQDSDSNTQKQFTAAVLEQLQD